MTNHTVLKKLNLLNIWIHQRKKHRSHFVLAETLYVYSLVYDLALEKIYFTHVLKTILTKKGKGEKI